MNNFEEKLAPEVLRSNIDDIILTIKQFDIDIYQFDFIDKPKTAALNESLESLKFLEALDQEEKLTDFGRLALSLDIKILRVLYEGIMKNCIREVVRILAMMEQSRHLFSKSALTKVNLVRYLGKSGDLISLLRLFLAWERLPSQKHERWSKGLGLDRKSVV